MAKIVNPRLGALLQSYRARMELTQDDLAKMSGISRNYIGAVERGQMQVVYPEKFNALHKVLKFPGWEALEMMGYKTDVVDSEKVSPKLYHLISQMTTAQQEAMFGVGKAMLSGHDGADGR